MKHLFSLLLIAAPMVAVPFSGTAQTSTGTTMNHHGTSSHSAALPASYPAHSVHKGTKTTADNASRLIAIAEQIYDAGAFEKRDSTTFAYTGSRGSGDFDYDYGFLPLSDNDYVYRYDASTTAYENSEKTTQTFDANNNVLTRTYQSWEDMSGRYENSSRELYTYDGSNNELSFNAQRWDRGTLTWENLFRNSVTYTTFNWAATSTFENWTGTAWENSMRYTNTFTGETLTSSITENWTGTAWENSNRSNYTHDGAGNELTWLQESWSSSSASWGNSYLFTYTYDAMNNRTSEIGQSWSASTSAWINDRKTEFSSYTGKQPGSVIYLDWNPTAAAFENSYRQTFTYNSYNQPVYSEEQQWNSGAGSWGGNDGDGKYRYYYELFTSAIPNAATTAGKLSIYPVPAGNNTVVNITWNDAQPFAVAITDVQGRIHSNWTVKSCTNYEEQIPLTDLASGTYFITVKGANGTLTSTMTVVK